MDITQPCSIIDVLIVSTILAAKHESQSSGRLSCWREATLLGIVGNGTIVRRLGLRFRGRSRLSIDRRNRIPRLGLRLFEGLALEGELAQQTFALASTITF